MTHLITRLSRVRTAVVLAVVLVALAASPAHAVPVFYIFDTSFLVPSAGTYSLDFQLTSSEAPTTNSAAIANLQLGGGGLLATQFYPPNGGHSGDASTTLTLMASDFFNSVTQDFTPGAFVGFDLDLTNVGPAGAIPDQFSFAILRNGVELPSGDTLGFNRLIRYDFTGDADVPTARFDLVAVPEPATLTLLGQALLLCAMARRQRRRR